MQKLQLKRQSRRNGERNKMEHKCSKLQEEVEEEEGEVEEEAVAQQGKRQRNKKNKGADWQNVIIVYFADFGLRFDFVFEFKFQIRICISICSLCKTACMCECVHCVCVCNKIWQLLSASGRHKMNWGRCAGAGRASTWPIQLSFCIVFSFMFAADNKPLGICQRQSR